jgi:hypothetical protein
LQARFTSKRAFTFCKKPHKDKFARKMHETRPAASLPRVFFCVTIKVQKTRRKADFMFTNYGAVQPNGYQNYQDPYSARLNSMLPRMEIVTVNGENGARAFQMPPNSRILLLDENAPLIWLAQTDGAGYKSVTPYTITPYQPEQPDDTKSLEARIKRLEDMLNAKPDSCTAE